MGQSCVRETRSTTTTTVAVTALPLGTPRGQAFVLSSRSFAPDSARPFRSNPDVTNVFYQTLSHPTASLSAWEHVLPTTAFTCASLRTG